MKKIFNIILTTVAMFAFAPVVVADGEGEGEEQEVDYSIQGVIGNLSFPKEVPNSYNIDETYKVGYSKNISSPQSDGTYWIKLEAFATGSATITSVSKPSDIILVLDYSSSMDETYYGSVSRKRALRNAVRAFLDTIRDNDAKARAAVPSYGGDRVAIISFNSTATKRADLTQINTGYSTLRALFNNDPQTGRYTNPADGLEEAMKQWQSGGNPTTDNDRNRAVVVFTDGCPSYHMSYAFDSDYVADAVTAGNTLKADYGASVYTIGLFNTSHNSWASLGQPIVDYMNFLSSNFIGVTAECNDYPGRPSSADGAINGTVTYSFTDFADLAAARAAEAYATQAEALAGNSDYFFMASDDPSSLSSIFNKVANQSSGTANQNLSSSTSTVDVVSSSFVFPEGATKDNIKVFTAKCINVAEVDGEKVYTFDKEILAKHSSDVYKIYDEAGNYVKSEDVDDKINVEFDDDAKTVSVTGFDYARNFCGPTTSGSTTTYDGHKLIIMIPIQMNPEAVGGPDVATNATGSGIKLSPTDPPIVPFVSPTVSLPVNIHIKKSGLYHGESARFKIERAQIPAKENWADPEGWTIEDISDNAWNYVSTVFVTQPEDGTDESPVLLQVRGLPSSTEVGTGVYETVLVPKVDDEGNPVIDENTGEQEMEEKQVEKKKQIGYVYRISEESWSWSYNRDETPQYTVTSKVDNPFEFSNSIKQDIEVKLHHAESKVNNVFKKTAATKVYNDSKTNMRE